MATLSTIDSSRIRGVNPCPAFYLQFILFITNNKQKNDVKNVIKLLTDSNSLLSLKIDSIQRDLIIMTI